jgi:hypothetical protein
LHYVLVGACRLAGGRPPATIGTDHMLVSLALRSLPLRRVLRSRLRIIKRALVSNPGDDGGAFSRRAGVDAAAEALREARWRGLDASGPQWSENARAALAGSASRVGTPAELLAAVLADPGNRAAGLLREAGIGRDELADAGREMASAPTGFDATPRTPVADGLLEYRVLAGQRGPSLLRRALLRRVRSNAVILTLELEAVRLAVRAGNPGVTTAHLVAATIRLEHDLRVTDRQFPAELRPRNGAGANLIAQGFDLPQCAEWFSTLTPSRSTLFHKGRPWRVSPSNPQWTDAAAGAAEETRIGPHAAKAGSGDLLAAVLADGTDSQARRMLVRYGVDIAANPE